eukprot:2714243-Pleurochrysis_carterae.AAC.1
MSSTCVLTRRLCHSRVISWVLSRAFLQDPGDHDLLGTLSPLRVRQNQDSCTRRYTGCHEEKPRHSDTATACKMGWATRCTFSGRMCSNHKTRVCMVDDIQKPSACPSVHDGGFESLSCRSLAEAQISSSMQNERG